MRYTRYTQRSRSAMGFNATPMVDVIFMLTIFFMLVSHFSSAEQVPMQLPKPDDSQAHTAQMPDRVVINCRLAGAVGSPSRSVLYSIGPNRPESLSMIAERLAVMKRESPETKVVVRADRRLRYEDVRAVMQVIAAHGIEMLNVVAHVAEDK